MEQEFNPIDLGYRSKIFTNINMEQGNEAPKYNKNISMKKVRLNDNVAYFFLNPEINTIFWNEPPYDIYFKKDLIFNIYESYKLNINTQSGENSIKYLTPINKDMFFYNVSNKLAFEKDSDNYNYDYFEEVAKRSFTSKNMYFNPYSKVGVFGFNPIFEINQEFNTLGIQNIYKNASIIQNRFYYYLDTMISNYFKDLNNLLVEKKISFDKNVFLNIISYVLGKEIITVNYNEKVLNNFKDIVINSQKLNYYNSISRTVDEKLLQFDPEKELDDQNKDLRLLSLLNYEDLENDIYFINLDVYKKESNKINGKDYLLKDIYTDAINYIYNELIKFLNGFDYKSIEKELKFLIYVFLVQNSLAKDLNDFSIYISKGLKNYDDDMFGEEITAYSFITEALNKDKNYITYIFTKSLVILNSIENNLEYNKDISHKYLSFKNEPIKGLLVKYLNKDIEINNNNKIEVEKYTGFNFDENIEEYKITNLNNIEGKSLVFEIPSKNGLRISLINLRNLNYESHYCKVIFDHVIISYGNKSIYVNSYDNGIEPYYECFYIHNKKDNERDTYSIIRLEFKPEMNIPEESWGDINNNSKLTTKFDFLLRTIIFSSIFYIKVDHFNNQKIITVPIIKTENNTFIIESKKNKFKIFYNITNKLTLKIEKIIKDDKEYIKGTDKDFDEFIKSYPNDEDSTLLENEKVNKMFKNYKNEVEVDNKTIVQTIDNNIDEEEEEDIDLFGLKMPKKPKKRIIVEKKMIINENNENNDDNEEIKKDD